MLLKIVSNCFHLIAKIYLKLKYPLIAISWLSVALRLSPKNSELYVSLAAAYQDLKSWDDVFNSLEKAAEIFPNDLRFNWAIGVLALNLSQGEKAIKNLLVCIINTNKEDILLLANRHAVLGNAYILTKNWDEAEEHLRKAISLVNWDLDACIGMIQLYQCTKRSNEIITFIDSYIEKYPSVSAPYMWKGDYFRFVLRKPEKSLELYQQALTKILDKETRDFCDSYISTHKMFDDIFDKYISTLVICDRKKMVFSEIQKYEHFNLGTKTSSIKRKILFYVDTERFDEAEKVLNRLNKKIIEMPEILFSIAYLRNKEGKFFEARDIIEKAIKANKDNIELYGLQGEIQININDWHGALDTYTYLLNRDFYTPSLMKKIGLCYFHLGNLENAVKYFKETLLHDEFDAETWICLGDTYRKQGNIELALSAYHNSLKFDWLTHEKRQYSEEAIKNLQ